MAEQDTKPNQSEAAAPPLPSLEEMQHWTWIMGRAQQIMLEHVARAMGEAEAQTLAPKGPSAQWPMLGLFAGGAKIAEQQVDLWTEGLSLWQRALGGEAQATDIAAKA